MQNSSVLHILLVQGKGKSITYLTAKGTRRIFQVLQIALLLVF